MSLEPKFTITDIITNALAKIERTRGFLDAATLSQEWIEQMSRRALLLEAHYTTHIEGTQLTLDMSERLLNGEDVAEADPEDRQELLNYRNAFDFVSDYLDTDAPITEGLIREIHRRLVDQVRGGKATPGEYRKIQNYVMNNLTGEIVYTPPPVYELPMMMHDLTDWLSSSLTTHPVLVSGIAQFQLVHIHPFLDGNGRTSRLLSTLSLYRSGYDFKRLFTISEFYDRDRPAFYEAIQSVRNNHMDMTGWLEYFVTGLQAQMQEVRDIGEYAIKRDLLVKKYQLTDRQRMALGLLSDHGYLTIQHYQNQFSKVSRRTLQRDLKDLLDKGILIAEGKTNALVYRFKPEK